MLKIRALNQESSSDEEVTTIRREAQEEIVLELYNNALRAQAQKEYDKSADILTQLLQENISQLENNGGLPKSMSTLKYSCHVNLGNIYLNQGNINQALESFTSASELDTKDVTLWAKIGKLALKEGKFNKAAHAFSKGLECSESHWPCLDNLISVLYAIRDTISCLVYIGKALILDADYTKGVVLRQQIYRDNPATKEYYQLYNPEHIWEPQIDVEVDKEEEEQILKEAQLLCDRVTEAEKVLGPKPFDTIPLPKALDDYTWLSLAKTVIYCHQYITDNNMSHFTFFDMNKCMSQSGEATEAPKLVEDIPIIKDNKINEAENNSAEVAAEKMDTEPAVVERRFSQNSENTTGNDNQDNTPTQTDNDEEQNMELDNDIETDGDNQGDNIDTTQQRRRGKRKRDVLSDLQIWGWHSKRKQPKKSNKDFTVEDALNRIIPKSLLKTKITCETINQSGEESMNTMDIYKMYVETKELNFLSPIHSPKSVNFEAYFGTDQEKDDVLNFWIKERLRVDAVVLVKELVFELSKLWRYQWPKELIPLYIEVYKMFREHCDQPQLFCGDHTFEEIRDDALATLLYGELLSFSTETSETVHPTILSYLQIVSSWSEDWKEESAIFFIRFYWLQAHCFRRTNENELAIRALDAILEEISSEENFSLSLSNCFKYGFISKQVIEKIIKHLNMIISLGNIENLFNSQKYNEVAEVLKHTFHSGSYTKVGRMGRPAQLGILMHSLWYTNWDECFVWTEECLNEAVNHYGKPNADQDKWEKIIEKCLGIFQEIIKKETVSVIDKITEDKRCRLVENLVKILRKQLNTENAERIPLGSISPWILLHYVLLREEHRQYAMKRLNQSKRDKIEVALETTSEQSEEELPPSIAILFSAHEFLGPKRWCTTGEGELLHFILDTMLDRLDTPIFEPLRDKIDIHIEQALFCLYSYPSKKNKISRHLVDHNVKRIPLTWERSFQLYQYYAPDTLPEFTSYKSQSISADLEELFKQIIALVPTICALHDHLPKIMSYIYGKTSEVPESVEFPGKVRAIYYLLGDYYFKDKQFDKCIKYFQLDLLINSMRLDSWASLALSYAAQLENILNYCEKLKNEADFFDKAKSAQVCFRKALELDPENCVLWIECGSFEYMVHSFCSRLIKYESENFSMEKFELLETEKESYLDSSGNSLEHAISLYEVDDSNEPDERWLQYYILGKIAEKKRKEPTEYLQYYMTASTLLNDNKATYPDKINYNNPQQLSVEALELHYRIHASVLKYLELHEGKDVANTLGAFFRKCLNSTAKRYVVAPRSAPPNPPKSVEIEQITPTTTNTSFQEQFLNSIKNAKNADVIELEDDEDARKIVRSCLDDLLEKVEEVIKSKEPEEVAKPEEPSNKQQPGSDKSEDLDVTIIENEEVIMIISDSEEETVMQKDVDAKETKMDVEEAAPVEDVQSLLDKMMEQTMKDTDKLNYSDPNNSGAEQVEEVTLKDDNNSKETKTDADNKKASADEDSSSSASSSSSDSSSSDSDSDDSDNSNSSSSTDSSNENISHNETLQLVDKCIQGLEICITRLPQNYKALYRLAHVFFNYKGRKDYTKCKQLLLSEYKCKDDATVTGLFAERNNKNFFNGIWRIPSTDIDRPGSLAAHMNRCISLVLQVLRNSNDTKTLMDVCMQLRKAPDRDKIYIKDSDRTLFSDQAMDMCVQSFRGQIKNIPNMQNQQITKLLHDIFKVYQRVQKHVPNKESVFSGLLTESYKSYIKEKIPENVNVLELAVKFCQQHRLTEKHSRNALAQTAATSMGFTSRSPGISNPPVHPAPSTLIPSQKPLKPPSVGRPRGRPPLPKIPGQARQSRAKSPINMYPWQNPMYGYEYRKQYQDELIKQYSQNLSLSQLKQLTNFFSTGQLNNPVVAQAVVNQFLTQMTLMNPTTSSNLLRPPTTSFLDASASQKAFNPPLSNLTSEQMKYLESMLPKPPKTSTVSSRTSTKVSSSKTSKPIPVFKEPSKVGSSEEKFMKDRPNISITPVGGLSITPTTSTSSLSLPKPTQTSSSSLFSKPSSSSATHTVSSFSITKQPSAPAGKLIKPAYIPTITSAVAPKSAAYIPTITTAAFSKPAPLSITPHSVPVAHSSASPKPAHVLPATPPPVSSPSFIKPGLSTSPGKTLQEKLADKKKEQETKQMMKNIEAEIYASKIPSSSASLLKGLNIPNIPSSLTVSPSSSASVNPYSMPSQSSFTGKVPVPKTLSYPVEHKLPSSLTLSKNLPPPVYGPRFPAESGISITQIASNPKDKSPPTEKQHQSRIKGPISLDNSVEISSSKNAGAPKSKPTISVKPSTFLKGSRDVEINRLSSKRSHNPEKKSDKQSTRKHKVDKPESGMQALSVIKKLSSIDISPVATTSPKKSLDADDDVICLD